MNAKLVRLLFVSICSVAAMFAASDKYVYSFEQFLVSNIFHGTPASPRLTSVWARTYRTRIREEIKEEGVNFAGHYTVAIWGCGSSCMSFAIVELISGQVFDPPFEALSTVDGTGNLFEGLVFKPNSQLLIASGCPQEKDCGVRYYRWSGRKLILLKTVLVPPRTER